MIGRTGAALAILAASLCAPQHAEARGEVTRFCGNRYCPTVDYASHGHDQPHRHAAHGHRRHRHSHHIRETYQRASQGKTGWVGWIRSSKTGATASVAAEYASRFQGLLNDLEAAGASVYYMGGWRRGRCSLRHQHSCGWAVDFCQDYRGHVSGEKDCHLPVPAVFHRMVVAHGLYDGSVWCSQDYGHVQAKDSSGCRNEPRGRWSGTPTGETLSAAAESRGRRTRRR